MKPGKPDWDALLSQGIIWSLLFGYLAILYVVVILIGSLLLQRPMTDYDPPWWMNLIALLISAPTFLPVYRWLRAGVRELVYSQQEHPYPALARLNQHLEAAPSPQLLLPNIAETIARALKLPYLEIETSQSGVLLAGVSGKIRYGSPVKGAAVERVPMNYLGTRMGEMLVSARSPYESLSPADLSVLHDLAQHAGSALYTARLTEDLQRARERLVITREEERRRIRNDLHDGLAPTLSALQIQLSAIRSLMREHPDQAEAIITEMREELRGATAEIRQLVYDLRPPRLDDLGLVGALKSTRTQHQSLQLEVAAPDPLPGLSAAVEVAVYRIASEAIHNVVKHAQATACEVQIEVRNDSLVLRVIDNGKGISGSDPEGVGLRSMRERALELGGNLTVEPHEPAGTCLTAQIPLSPNG